MKNSALANAGESMVGIAPTDSTFVRLAPKLSHRGLTILLAVMCLVPVVTISWLWWALPPVQQGVLPCAVELVGVPPKSYYELPESQRRTMPRATIVVTNTGDHPWTHINIRVNKYYQTYEHDRPLMPGESRGYLLDRFVSRLGGAPLDVRLVRVKHVEVYARLPNATRATFVQEW